MDRLFDRPYAPSTLGSFVRAFTFGHVRQLDTVASRLLAGLAVRSRLLADVDGPLLVDVDDMVIQVHVYTKQGAGFGYTGVRGLNALLATVTTTGGAPVIVAQRLRMGSCGSPRAALQRAPRAALQRAGLRPSEPILLRADAAFYGSPTIGAAVRAGAQVSVTIRMDTKVKAAIATIAEDAWTPIEYTDAVYDEDLRDHMGALLYRTLAPGVVGRTQVDPDGIVGRRVRTTPGACRSQAGPRCSSGRTFHRRLTPPSRGTTWSRPSARCG